MRRKKLDERTFLVRQVEVVRLLAGEPTHRPAASVDPSP
jgi:hypothetical protein